MLFTENNLAPLKKHNKFSYCIPIRPFLLKSDGILVNGDVNNNGHSEA